MRLGEIDAVALTRGRELVSAGALRVSVLFPNQREPVQPGPGPIGPERRHEVLVERSVVRAGLRAIEQLDRQRMREEVAERHRVLDHGVGDAVDLGHLGWDRHARIDERRKALAGLAAFEAHHGDLAAAIEADARAGRFRVEPNRRRFVPLHAKQVEQKL